MYVYLSTDAYVPVGAQRHVVHAVPVQVPQVAERRAAVVLALARPEIHLYVFIELYVYMISKCGGAGGDFSRIFSGVVGHGMECTGKPPAIGSTGRSPNQID